MRESEIKPGKPEKKNRVERGPYRTAEPHPVRELNDEQRKALSKLREVQSEVDALRIEYQQLRLKRAQKEKEWMEHATVMTGPTMRDVPEEKRERKGFLGLFMKTPEVREVEKAGEEWLKKHRELYDEIQEISDEESELYKKIYGLEQKMTALSLQIDPERTDPFIRGVNIEKESPEELE